MGEAHAAEGGTAVRKVECIGDVGESPPACRNIPTFPDKPGICSLRLSSKTLEGGAKPRATSDTSLRVEQVWS
jgi:hypothetical protein